MPYKNEFKRADTALLRNLMRRRNFPWKQTLDAIKQRCNNPKASRFKYYGGRGIKCLITSEELKVLWFRDRAFEMVCPSIDREDSNGHYEFSNCRYLERVKNSQRMAEEKNPVSKIKAVAQYSLDGTLLKIWNSAVEIQKLLKYDRGLISKVCNNKRNQAYGFSWRFV